ncbi:MAG TPA: GNAT family N-acetyltransferase [Bryobacteraceae bacterium]|nr:GNAT family N-acetyltransferase [Bryobacteraceae bacterium]
MPEPAIVNNEPGHQFEWSEDGETAVLTYRLRPESITFLHTGVPRSLEGRGIAAKLAVAGLTYARANGLAVVPLCPYVAAYIRKHPEYLDIVREDHRARLSALTT